MLPTDNNKIVKDVNNKTADKIIKNLFKFLKLKNRKFKI